MGRLWACPNGCGSKRGPERPRRNATIRYCLACSERTGSLVERVSPAAERERTEHAARRRARSERRAAAANDRQIARRTVTDGKISIDIDATWAAIWATPTGRDVRRNLGRIPPLVWRRKALGLSSGRAFPWQLGGRTVATIGPDPADAVGLLVHEAAHVACDDHHHSPEWRAMFRTLARELHGIEIEDPGGSSHVLHERIEAAIDRALRSIERGRPGENEPVD